MSDITVFTVTTSQNIDELTAKAGGDTYNINGGTLTIDQDSRGGLNGTTSASIGVMALSATLGGTVEIDARNVRLIPYNTGTGNVPAWNTTISIGGASGKLIGVYSALNVASTATGAAMPASGYIKVKQWNGTPYTSGALTGIGATATGADVAGWIEVVADEALNISVNRLNLFRVRGDWFEIGTTDGTRATTYQIPSNGVNQYHAGVWVETGSSTGVYEFYPCAGTLTAVSTSVGTEEARGKVCWIDSTGLLRFGHDGTNSTGGYIPPTGRRIRIPNVFLTACTTAARTANSVPNTTLATRPEFTTTGGGALDINNASCGWCLNIGQAYSFNMTNTGVLSTISASEVASPMTWTDVGVGHNAAVDTTALTMSLCFAGGTFTRCHFRRRIHSASNGPVGSLTDISGFTFTDCFFGSLVKTSQTNAQNVTATRMKNCTFTNLTLGCGQAFNMVTCDGLTFTNTVYYDCIASTTITTQPSYVWIVGSGSKNITMDGLTFGGLTMVQPYSGILSVAAAGCSNIKLRNIGTASAPLDLGGDTQYGVSWSRTTTTATVTKTAHGLKVNDIIYVYISSDTPAITVAAKTVASVPTADTFTFTCLNAGAASGTLTYYPTMSATPMVVAAAAAANNVKMQRCYFKHARTNLVTGDNSSKNIVIESSWAGNIPAPTFPFLNAEYKMLGASAALTAQTAVYGSHWLDWFYEDDTPNMSAQSWSRTTTTATVTSTDHGLRTGSLISVTVSSDTAAIVLGQKSITVTGKDTFTFTCLNAGGTSGTLTFQPYNGSIGLLMNETTAETTSVVTIDSGTPGFTSAGGFYMPTVGQQATFETPYYLLGHSTFPIALPVMAGGTIGNYDITYAIDRGDGNGYSSFKNLAYPRAGGGGSNGSTNVTMTDTTGVAVGDYVFGTNIAPLAKVTSITNSTTVVVDKANTGTVSGVLTFNQLPSEAALPATGVKLKVRIKTTTTNATAITSLRIYTYVTPTTRGYQYPLDPVTATLSLTGLKANSEVRVFRTSDDAELAGIENSGTSFTYNYEWTGTDTNAYIVIHHLDYLPIRYEGQILGQNGLTLPIQQQTDRQYLNP